MYTEDLKIRTEIDDKEGTADALWGLAEVHRLREEYTKASALYTEALEIRNEIDDTVCLNLVRSMPKRLAAVRQAKGGYTTY